VETGPPPSAPQPAPGQGSKTNPWLDKRKFVRFNPTGAVVELSLPRRLMGAFGLKRAVPARIVDLSEGGAAFFVPEELAKGSTVGVRIQVKELGDVLELQGIVTRITPPLPGAKAQEWIVGVDFAEIAREVQIKIAGWRSYTTSTMMRRKTDDRRRDLGISS
jgi:hypothetical protein